MCSNWQCFIFHWQFALIYFASSLLNTRILPCYFASSVSTSLMCFSPFLGGRSCICTRTDSGLSWKTRCKVLSCMNCSHLHWFSVLEYRGRTGIFIRMDRCPFQWSFCRDCFWVWTCGVWMRGRFWKGDRNCRDSCSQSFSRLQWRLRRWHHGRNGVLWVWIRGWTWWEKWGWYNSL